MAHFFSSLFLDIFLGAQFYSDLYRTEKNIRKTGYLRCHARVDNDKRIRVVCV